MQATTRGWILDTVSKLPEKDIELLRDYLEFLVWKNNQVEPGKNPIAQRIIQAMEQPPELTHGDADALLQSIEEGKIPMRFESPFDEPERVAQIS